MRKQYLAILCLIGWGLPLWIGAESATSDLFLSEPAPEIAARLSGGLIFIEAVLDGKLGTYILDTGASHLFINQKNTTETDNLAAGLGAGTVVREATIDRFQLGSKTYSNRTAYEMDLTHLERIKACPIAGIIGMDMLKDFQLFINYKAGIVSLQTEQTGSAEISIPARTIPLVWQQHFPTVVLTVDQQSFNFAIDTGAEANLFYDSYEEHIEKSVRNKSVSRVWGIGDEALTMKKIQLTQLYCMDRIYYNQEFMFANLSGLNKSYAVALDGILGFPFLKHQSFTLDFKAGEMKIW